MKGSVEIKEDIAEAREGYGGKRNHQADPCLRPPFCYPSWFIAITRDVENRRSVIESNQGYSLHSLDNHLVKASYVLYSRYLDGGEQGKL